MEQIEEFKQFDVVSDDSDHHYLNFNNDQGDCFSNARNNVNKKIMKEWRILAQNLPESIYVRTYEKRIDLLRAVIVGAAGTPYHDGLFFFDIAFPPRYPNYPPKVRYRSYGFKLNPNLYSNGHVCLSLINTWLGKENERWNPSESTVLQLLVSLQALVLNEKPYLNEAGFLAIAGWLPRIEKYARAYNQTAFLLHCKTMIMLLHKPPNNFESFVMEHFCDRANTILKACNEYANERVRVGYYNQNELISCSKIKVSEKFKKGMQELYPQLVEVFQHCGASLENSLEQLEVGKRWPWRKALVADGKYNGALKKAFRRIQKVLATKMCGKYDNNVNEIEERDVIRCNVRKNRLNKRRER